MTEQKRIIKLPEVIRKVGLGKTEIYQRISEGTFPKQVRLGGRSVGWVESEIDDWIEKRISERDHQQAA
jgi:prophage regulatory protein